MIRSRVWVAALLAMALVAAACGGDDPEPEAAPTTAAATTATTAAMAEETTTTAAMAEETTTTAAVEVTTTTQLTGTELAGGEEGLAEKWGKSREISWDEVAAYQPDYLMVMPCAFDMARTEEETRQHLFSHPTWGSLRAVKKGNVYLFDGLIPSRHGPRVIDVLEGLAEAMHPEKFAGLARPGVFHKAEL